MFKSLFITSILSFNYVSNSPRIVDSFPNFDSNVVVYDSNNVDLTSDFNFTNEMKLNGNYNLFFFITFEIIPDEVGPYEFEPHLIFQGGSIYISLSPFMYSWGNDRNKNEYHNSCDCSFSTFNNPTLISLLYDFSNTEYSYSCYLDSFIDAGVDADYSLCYINIVAVPTQSGSSVPNAEQIYNNGYNAGFSDALKNENINDMLTQNYEAGYQVGFEKGKIEGMNSNPDNNILSNALFSIVDLPLIYLNSLLNFEIFGINLLGLFGFMIAIALLIFIFKRL